MTIINCIKIKELGLFSEFFLAITTIYIIMFNLLSLRLKRNKFFLAQDLNLNLNFLILFLAVFLLLNNDFKFLNYSSFYFTTNSNYFVFVTKFFVISLSIFFLMVIKSELKFQKINRFEYIVLFLFSVLGFLFLITAADLIIAYLSIELQSLVFYVLTSFTRNSNYSVASGLKYFVLSSLTSAFFLFGCSFVYGILGTLNFQELRVLCFLKIFNGFYVNLLQFSLLFILISLLFKLTAAPFHFWVPTIYEGAPTTSVIFFTVLPKIGIFVLMLRFYYHSFYYLVDFWKFYVILASIASVFVSSIGGLEQRKLKTLLVYSGIGHMGYLLLLVGSVTIKATQILLIYLFVYKISSICTWFIILITKLKATKGQKQSRDLSNLAQLKKSNLPLAIITSFSLFSIAGLPPLVGFLPKASIFLFALKFSFYFPIILLAFFSIIATFYYLRVVKVIFFEKVLVGQLYYQISKSQSFILSIFMYFLVFIFITPNLLHLVTYEFLFAVFYL